MSKNTGRRLLLSVHRWAGLVSAIFLIILALTGLALNHATFLGLDRIMIDNEFVLQRYGMDSDKTLESFRINKADTITHYYGHLFYNEKQIASGSVPVGVWSGQQFSLVATNEQLVLLSGEGELVEKIVGIQLPRLPVEGLGETANGDVILIAGDSLWIPDQQWLDFEPYSGDYTALQPDSVELPKETRRKMQEHFRGEGISLYRVLLDLHSGRLFGLGGRFLMDLAALAILVLVSSGIAGWRRRRRNPGP